MFDPVQPTGNNQMKPHRDLALISLKGLTLAPPQVYGGVRLVPLLRQNVQSDLRLARRKYGDNVLVDLPDRSSYYCYAPHALVANWTNDGKSTATFGTQVKKHKVAKTKDGSVIDFGFATARVMAKMRAREGQHQLRFLPMEMAMEGFLAIHFGGPDIAWEEYSRQVKAFGLGSRSEAGFRGIGIVGLEDALRAFEIHPTQVGTLVFVNDALASVFVVPHPDDYCAMHRTLVTDLYGELVLRYGMVAQPNDISPTPIDSERIISIDDLRNGILDLRTRWEDLNQGMVESLLGRHVHLDEVYKMGPFLMQRFVTDLEPKSENHIGERIVRADGTLEYMKTFRLSSAQCRRAYLLKQLANSNWELGPCAVKLSCTKNQLIHRLDLAGFSYLLHQHVLDAARSSRRKKH